MAFVPPLFSKLGKSASDLFTKKYDFKNTLQTKNRTKSGLTFTSGFDVSNTKGVGGQLKLKYKKDTFGEAEADFNTAGAMKGSIKAKKLVKNAVLIASADGKPKNHPKEPLAKAGVEYQREFFSGQANFETSFWKHSLVHGAAVIGFDGLSIGAEAKVDPHHASKVEDYGVAAQYDQPDYTVTVKTADKGESLTAQGFLKASADHQVGVSITKQLDGSDNDSFALGTEYKVDAVTKIKAKGDTKGILSGVVEHRLRTPQILFSFASSVDAANIKSGIAAKDFGVSCIFGDYEDDD
jgi:hypothetical protein